MKAQKEAAMIKSILGNINNYSVKLRKTRPVGCPMRVNLPKDLQKLATDEIYVAFAKGHIKNKSNQRPQTRQKKR